MKSNYKLLIINFLQFFIWGAWLLSAGAYMSNSLDFSGVQIGSVYATLGLASLLMPTLMGIIADRYLPYKVVFVLCHFIVAILLVLLVQVHTYAAFYLIMLGISLFYVPTIPLNNSIAFAMIAKNNGDVIKAFPPIRVLGTLGFIAAAWCVDLLDWKFAKEQFILSAVAAVSLGIFTLLVLPGKSLGRSVAGKTKIRIIDGITDLLQKRSVIVFFIFTIFLGSILQVTNIWGVPFLDDFKLTHPDSFIVKYPVIILSVSQISEVLFILTIPSLYKKMGIKLLTLISMIAWVFRFGLFAVSSPEGIGLVFLIGSMIVYGMAFDFFNISGALFVEKESDNHNRGVSQGIFAFTTGGLGPIIGGYLSGIVVDYFTFNGGRAWFSIWIAFAIYAVLICILFALLFKHKNHTEKTTI